MFDLLRGTHWTLLAFDYPRELLLDKAEPDHLHVHRIGTDQLTDLHDTEGHVQHSYRPQPGELILVRPDGYIAARTPASHEQRLLKHLGAF